MGLLWIGWGRNKIVRLSLVTCMNDEHPDEYDPEKGVTSGPPEPPSSGYPGDYQDPGMSYQGYSLEELAGAEDGGEGEEIYSKPA